MRIEVPRHRPALIRLTPLIDVVFILLVFFMLASSFLDWRGFDLALPAPGAVQASAEHEPVIVEIHADGRRTIGGMAVGPDDITERLVADLAANPERPVHLRAADAVPVQETVRVLDQLHAAGAHAVAIQGMASETDR